MPVSLEQTLIPVRFFPGIEDVDVSVFSLYETYAMYGRKVAFAQEKLDVVALSTRDAGLLQVEPGSLALSLECLSFDDEGSSRRARVRAQHRPEERLHLRVLINRGQAQIAQMTQLVPWGRSRGVGDERRRPVCLMRIDGSPRCYEKGVRFFAEYRNLY